MQDWLRKSNQDMAEDYAKVQQQLSGDPSKIQISGDHHEATWRRFLRLWLPPAYEVAEKSKHLLLEHPVDDRTISHETDIVVFDPTYPKRLREREEILVSGVAAAFSTKLTLRTAHIKEASEHTELVQRGIDPRRGPARGLESPLLFGLLAQSHDCGLSPVENITKALESEHNRLLNPRYLLDVVCVANLDCWVKQLTFWRRPHPPPDSGIANECHLHWMHTPGPTEFENFAPAPPVAILIHAVWQKFAARHPEMRNLASGFTNIGMYNAVSGRGQAVPVGGLPAGIFDQLGINWPYHMEDV